MADAGPVYLDHHSTTPCDPAVFEAMRPYFVEAYGNAASRSHLLGLQARAAVERARSQVAQWVGASPKAVVFTSGATESDNLAILGLARRSRGTPHVVTVATEHPAVLDPVRALARREGAEVTVLPVDGEGLVAPDDVAAAIRPETVLVSVMRVNNEIGVVQPLREIAEVCRARGVRVHTDAAQAAYVDVDLEALGVDLISLSGHKIYGPKGVGALVMRRGRPKLELEPLQYGGGHERGLRSGTLPVPLVVGLGEAAARVSAAAASGEVDRVRALRDRLWEGLQSELPDVVRNGPSDAHRAPNNLHVSFAGVEAQALLVAVRQEVSLSTGSACSSETVSPSHVLVALGHDEARVASSVRFGLGRTTTEADIDRATEALTEQVRRLRAG